jgi:hypothetical protein
MKSMMPSKIKSTATRCRRKKNTKFIWNKKENFSGNWKGKWKIIFSPKEVLKIVASKQSVSQKTRNPKYFPKD